MYCTRVILAHVILTVVLFTSVHAYKVLFIPVPENSHIMLHGTIAEAMIKRGHQVHMIKPRSLKVPSQLKNAGIKFLPWEREDKKGFVGSAEFEERLAGWSKLSVYAMLQDVQKLWSRHGEEVLENVELFQNLTEENYDFILGDDFPGNDVCYLLAHALNRPYGATAAAMPFSLFSTTLQVHFLKTIFIFYSNEPSFIMRFLQFIFVIFFNNFVSFNPDAKIMNEFIKHRPVNNMNELKENVKIWLMDSEPLVGVPQVTAPNMIILGAMTAGKPNPLPKEIQTFADNAKEGLIVVSFGGGNFANFPKEQTEKLIKAFNTVKFKVIMRLKTKSNFESSKNVMFTDWLPQNDLLGHSNTVLFITHGGLGSLNEATYHGVPMIVFPNQDEQRGNAYRVKYRGYADVMDRDSFTAQELSSMISKVVDDKSYKEVIGKASAIMKARRHTARDDAVFWIEHVIKFGADHLKPYTAQLRWYEIMMYDVLALLLLMLLVTMFIMFKCCLCCRRLLCREVKKQKKR